MNEIELKPCPFCGGKAMFRTVNNYSTNYCVGVTFEVKCSDCGIRIPKSYNTTFSLKEDTGELNALQDERKTAIEDWNRRAE